MSEEPKSDTGGCFLWALALVLFFIICEEVGKHRKRLDRIERVLNIKPDITPESTEADK